jgi:hypothetical protein
VAPLARIDFIRSMTACSVAFSTRARRDLRQCGWISLCPGKAFCPLQGLLAVNLIWI